VFHCDLENESNHNPRTVQILLVALRKQIIFTLQILEELGFCKRCCKVLYSSGTLCRFYCSKSEGHPRTGQTDPDEE
jgi:hypothetical protein